MLKPNYDIAKDRTKTKINYLDVDNEIKKIYPDAYLAGHHKQSNTIRNYYFCFRVI